MKVVAQGGSLNSSFIRNDISQIQSPREKYGAACVPNHSGWLGCRLFAGCVQLHSRSARCSGHGPCHYRPDYRRHSRRHSRHSPSSSFPQGTSSPPPPNNRADARSPSRRSSLSRGPRRPSHRSRISAASCGIQGDFFYTKDTCKVEKATKIFVEGVVNGKTNAAILSDLNQPGVGNTGNQSEDIYAVKSF